MTVKQLVDMLQKLPPDLEVVPSDDPEDGINFTPKDVILMRSPQVSWEVEDYGEDALLPVKTVEEAEFAVIVP